MPSAGGKLILCGEHAVVHGGDALVVGLDRGVDATATGSSSHELWINDEPLAQDSTTVEALRRVAIHLESGPVGVRLRVTMPLGVGLGGSAAMAVATSRAIGQHLGNPLSDDLAFTAAQVWERVFHGNPSGVDAAAATYGGCLVYNREEFQRSMSTGRAQPNRVTVRCPLTLVVAVAGPPSLTKTMVERVAEFRARAPQAFGLALAEIQEIVARSRTCLEQGLHHELGALLSRNHELLAKWELSTPALDQACEVARSHGAFGAKLTGAGGGGCIVAVCSESTVDDVIEGLGRAQFLTLRTDIAATHH